MLLNKNWEFWTSQSECMTRHQAAAFWKNLVWIQENILVSVFKGIHSQHVSFISRDWVWEKRHACWQSNTSFKGLAMTSVKLTHCRHVFSEAFLHDWHINTDARRERNCCTVVCFEALTPFQSSLKSKPLLFPNTKGSQGLTECHQKEENIIVSRIYLSWAMGLKVTFQR